MSKHTHGPWITNGRAIEQDADDDALVVAYAEDEQNDDWEANARLIAAAPDLLEACKIALAETLRANEHFKSVSPATAMLEAAIAKAEGRA